MDSEPIIKTCACGKAYTQAQWEALTKPPTFRFPWGAVYEYRNCTCGSTITVTLEEGEFDPSWD